MRLPVVFCWFGITVIFAFIHLYLESSTEYLPKDNILVVELLVLSIFPVVYTTFPATSIILIAWGWGLSHGVSASRNTMDVPCGIIKLVGRNIGLWSLMCLCLPSTRFSCASFAIYQTNIFTDVDTVIDWLLYIDIAVGIDFSTGEFKLSKLTGFSRTFFSYGHCWHG